MLRRLCRIAVLGAALAAASVSHAQLIIPGGSSSGSGATPGGSSGQLQFNNAGAFGGGAGTTWDDTNRSLTIANAGATQSLLVTFSDLKFNRAGASYVYNANAGGSLKVGVGGAADGITVNSDKTVSLYSSLSAPSFISAGSYFQAGTGIAMPAGGWIQYNAGMTLIADGANTLALRNGANVQTFNLYGAYTDASNYERLSFTFGSLQFKISAENAGTGAARYLTLAAGANIYINGGSAGGRAINFQSAGSPIWYFSSSGHLLAETDNLYTIGANGANRPYRIYVANRVSMDDLAIPTNGVWANSDTASFTAGISQDAWIKRIGAGIFRVQNGSSAAGVIVTATTTVSGLPSAATAGAGARGYVTDATACTFLGAITGGGSTKCPVVSDGTNWTGG